MLMTRAEFERKLAHVRRQNAKERQRESIRQRAIEADGRLWVRVGKYLQNSQRAAQLERYVTAMAGCQTTYSMILDASKYNYGDVSAVPNATPADIPFNQRKRYR
jgi:chlorite dismutase